jgi:hypothetical protein
MIPAYDPNRNVPLFLPENCWLSVTLPGSPFQFARSEDKMFVLEYYRWPRIFLNVESRKSTLFSYKKRFHVWPRKAYLCKIQWSTNRIFSTLKVHQNDSPAYFSLLLPWFRVLTISSDFRGVQLGGWLVSAKGSSNTWWLSWIKGLYHSKEVLFCVGITELSFDKKTWDIPFSIL